MTYFGNTGLELFAALPYKVADMTERTIEFGRKEIELSLDEMPGLTELRKRYAGELPLKGARIMGSLHMTVQAAILIETLTEMGAEIRWVSCNIFSTQDHAASAVVAGPKYVKGTGKFTGPAVFAWKDESLEEYWWCTLQALMFPDGKGPTLIVDDGGDATLLVHLGYECEQSGKFPDPDSACCEEEKVIYSLLQAVKTEKGNKFWHKIVSTIKGVSEETTTGVHRLYQRAASKTLLFPAINVNDSVTKSKFDNLYGCRHSLVDAIMRATDRMISGRKALVCGFGDVGKGSVASLRSQEARVAVTEVDPICALQACMKGLQVMTVNEAIDDDFEIYITATGNCNIITAEQMSRMKHNAIVCNIGHFDNEIDMAGLERMRKQGRVEKIEIKPQVHEWRFKATEAKPQHSVIILAEGRLCNLGCATGHPSFVMSNSFTNQVLSQLDLHKNGDTYSKTVQVLSRKLDEQVARLHLASFGAHLTHLTREQADYIGVPVEGPFKDDTYRY